ncbi:MAG: DMT family transporter [Gemmobacter sp.]|nr:DMT family transporter [Gemmobacter sp.]
MRLSPTAAGIGLAVLTALIFSALDALAKALVAEVPAVQLVWARYAGQTVIVALLLAPRWRTGWRTRYPRQHALRSVFQFGATALFFSSLAHIGLAEATAIMDIAPVLISLGASVFLGERLGPRRLAGVLVALAGAMIIIRPGLGVFSSAAMLPVGAAVCYAGYAIITRKVGADEPVLTALFYTGLLGTVITSALVPWVWKPVAGWHWIGMAGLGVLGGAAQYCMIRAYSLAEASVIAPFGYVGLLFATLWGVGLFGEVPDRWTVVGALVIVAAGLYVWHRETRGARGG